jgi:hypothetical protein
MGSSMTEELAAKAGRKAENGLSLATIIDARS